MKMRGFRGFGWVLALAVMISFPGCKKLKEAAEEAAGIKQLSNDSISELKTQAEWGEAEDNVFEVLFGFELTDKFKEDLGRETKIDLSFLPGNVFDGVDKSGKDQALALVKKMEFTIEAVNKTFTRFEIVSLAKVEDKKLVIAGGEIAKYLDDSQRIKKDNKNQDGMYLLMKGKSAGMIFLNGKIELKKADSATLTPVDAIVYTDNSPFVTKSGKSTGQYLLAMLEGDKGNVNAYRKGIVSDFSATGTPESVSVLIPYSGVIPDDKKDEATAKASQIKEGLGETVDNWADKANDKVSTLLGLWKVQQADLLFVQPVQAPPPPPPLASNQAPETPTVDKPSDPQPPATDAPVMQIPPRDEVAAPPQMDLGCVGKTDAGEETLITDGAKFDDYTKYKGWRAMGDVRITTEEHDKIFGDPATVTGSASRYPDRLKGYCLLSTGDALYQKSVTAGTAAPQLIPGPNGDGKVSEMWQKVAIPSAAKAIQLRVAFFSQEFPYYVGSQFNDSFMIKFDEWPEPLAAGNLNALAGEDISNCQVSEFGDTQHKCGEWQSVFGNAAEFVTHGELWDIASSSQAPSYATQYKCSQTTGTKCYHGMIPPRVICKTLPDDVKGKQLTLRISVSDLGDSYFDSALAVDSVIFSTEGCADGQIFSGDDRSAISDK